MRVDTGQHIYSNGLIRALLATGATGTLITYSSDNIVKPVAGLNIVTVKRTGRIRALSLLSAKQSDAYLLTGKSFANLVKEHLSENPDCIVVDYFAMGWILPMIKAAQAGKSRRGMLIYISHNYESEVRRQVAESVASFLLRQIMRLDAIKGAALDMRLAKTADMVVTITDEDRRAYERALPGKYVVTVSPGYDDVIEPTSEITEATPRNVIITGSFEWIAKLSSLRRFLEAAEEPFCRAGLKLLVVGKVPKALLDEWSQKTEFCSFTGWVENVRPYMKNGRIGLLPDDVGGGFKLKFLYYIFSGLPIAAIRSQIAGLPVDVERDMISADSIGSLVKEIIAVIDDLPKLNGMRQRCWDACSSRYSWSERGETFRRAIDKMLVSIRH